MSSLTSSQIESFRDNGFLFLENIIPQDQLKKLDDDFEKWKEQSKRYTEPFGNTFDNRPRFDIEPGHCADRPALRRIASPIEISDIYLAVMRNNAALDALVDVIGPNIKVEMQFMSGEWQSFDKLVIATPPDQVLSLLDDVSEFEIQRFVEWNANHAETVIHTDSSIYSGYGINRFSEFDLFQKDTEGGAGYNAYLNRPCGLPEKYTHYHLAFNLTEKIDPGNIIDRQLHHTPFYTVEALRHRNAVIDDNGVNSVYYAGAWLGDGLHEGAVSSAIAVAKLLDGRVSRLN